MDIKIEGLTKSYGLQRAVDGISFEITSGEIVGFLGPNGAGKTTTMKMITQYLTPDGGMIWYGHHSSHGTDIRKHIGYLPEHNPLYEDMAVIDYLHFAAALQGVPMSEIPHRIRQMIKICGLDVEKHKKIGELSKGFRQRVGLAQAIIHNPKVLILDEPTTGLDPNQIVEIRALIRELGKEKTVILSTHILPEVEATCDRILIIDKGRIVADGTIADLRKQLEGKQMVYTRIEGASAEEITQSLLKLPMVLSVDPGIERIEVHVQPGQSANKAIYRMCVDNNWDLLELTTSETKLEDIFRHLTLN